MISSQLATLVLERGGGGVKFRFRSATCYWLHGEDLTPKRSESGHHGCQSVTAILGSSCCVCCAAACSFYVRSSTPCFVFCCA